MTKEVLAVAEKNLEEMQSARKMAESVLTNQGWVVTCDGCALDFDIDEEGRVSNCKVVPAHKARRLSRVNAEGLAPHVKNGRSTVGKPSVYVVVLDEQIKSAEETLIRIKRIAAAKEA